MHEIINKVSQSDLINFDLEDFYPKGKRVSLDLAQFYDENELIREKKFREDLKNFNWEIFSDYFVNIYDSKESIIPAWTMILITSYLSQVSRYICFGSEQDLERELFINELIKIDFNTYKNKKIIIKGCSKKTVPQSAYIYLIQKLQPLVKSIMYGEACSSVPIYKLKK